MKETDFFLTTEVKLQNIDYRNGTSMCHIAYMNTP